MVNEHPQIGRLVKQAQAVLRTRMDQVLRPLGLSTPQYVCLHLLNREPGISAAELARGTFVTRQSMTTLLQSLQDRGLVERPARATSGRALPAVLTPAGADALSRAQTLVDGVEARMLSGFSQSSTEALASALSACIAALEEPPSGSPKEQ